MKEIKMIGQTKVNVPKRRNDIWNFFREVDQTYAQCNYCHGMYNYQTTYSHLRKHVKKKHPDAILQFENQNRAMDPSENGLCDTAAEGNLSLKPRCSKDCCPKDEPAARALTKDGENLMRRSSPAWQYFKLLNERYAQCKICGLTISHLSISNLMRHVIRKHPMKLLAKSCIDQQKNVEEDEDDTLADDPTLQSQNPSMITDNEEESEEETSEDIKSTSDAQISAFRRSEQKKADYPRDEEIPTVKIEPEDVSMDEDLQHSFLEDSTAAGKSKKSLVWQVFIKLEDGSFQCQICGMRMSKKSCIGNLMRHTKRAHPSWRSAMQRGITIRKNVPSQNRVKISNRNRLQRIGTQPVIHTFERETKSISTNSDVQTSETQTACSYSEGLLSEQLVNEVVEQNPIITECTSIQSDAVFQEVSEASACNSSDTTRCVLSERLVQAVEEGNQLLRSLQNAVERQGEALSRLVAYLEGKNQMQKNDT